MERWFIEREEELVVGSGGDVKDMLVEAEREPSCSQKDRLLPGRPMKDGYELVSANGMFRLRFFSPQNMEKVRYLGIFYTDIDRGNEPVVWVANRNIPIPDNSGRLTIDTTDGNLKILHNGGNPIAVSSVRATGNTSATLLQTGNLVLHEIDPLDPLSYQWQSFDYPTDTLLPGMKLGIDFKNRKKWFLRSWITPGSPAEGPFTLGMDPNVTNQLIIWWEGEAYWTTGLWRNGSFSESLNDIFYYFSFISYKQIAYFNLPSFDDAKRQYLMLNSDGSLTTERGYSYNPCSSGDDLSDNCVVKLPICRRSIPTFQMKPGFMSGVGLRFKESDNMTYLNCRNKCLNNCSCVAFATNNYTSCEIWSRGTKFTESSIGNFQQIYMEFAVLREEKQRWLWTMFIMGVTGALLVLLLCSLWYQIRRKCKAEEEKWWISLSIVVGVAIIIPLLCYLCYKLCRKFEATVKSILDRKKLLRELGDTVSLPTTYGKDKMQANDLGMKHDLKIFDFQNIAAATDNFSNVNKLGEGGFGPVYKGTLLEGEKVAIKRLSRRSGQGMVEFKNEAKVIAKLQHNNLVRLLGCSLKGEERILVYEYMPNKSLDFFIFDSSRRNLLNWKKRFNIIEGIAQGLIYLHKYSRLRVIHRDLKASNILLDGQMNPKISDFGMAKIFGLNETEANTNRVVGTYGYMSPEYAMSGIVSMKTDVFSFGVLVLEIVSGKKNNSCYHSEHPLNLVGYAWQLWNEGKGLELKDPTLKESCSDNEVLRCLHVGLLCVQDRTKDRPTMSDVVSMLASETMPLPPPKQPAFFININSEEPQLPESNSRSYTINDVTISDMAAR